jgi:hypothetical protein
MGYACGNGADATAKRAFSNWTTMTCDDGYERTSPMGSFQVNPFGLFDITGNVWSGRRIATSIATHQIQKTANPTQWEIALLAFFAAVLGTPILSFSVPRTGPGAFPPTGSAISASVWPGVRQVTDAE